MDKLKGVYRIMKLLNLLLAKPGDTKTHRNHTDNVATLKLDMR